MRTYLSGSHTISKKRACLFLSAVLAGIFFVFSGWAAQEDYSTWLFAQRIVLNTSASGANISGNVYGFPILVRVNPSNFNGFSNTLPQGADVRFAKANGTALPYEIERWIDGASNNDTAEIWVRTDTILGNNGSQYIMMYWGKSGVTGRSSGAPVFDTANGFVAVYHLRENQANTADATYNNLGGARMGSPVQSTGIIGYGQSFAGSGAYYKTNAFDKCNFGAAFSVSAWIYLPSAFGNYGALWSKGSDDLTWSDQEVQFYLGNNTTGTGQQGRFPQLVGHLRSWMNSGTAMGRDAWQQVTFVYRQANDARQVFINGQSVALSNATYLGGTDIAGHPFFIGRDISPEAVNDFRGVMDEVVVSKIARPANWIKLCYENQKPAPSLVSFVVVDNESYATWPSVQRVYLNTTPSGANIPGTVTNFPLLIRLNPSTFKGFSQTLPGGADLRFAKSNGSHLPYEIERWVDGAGNNDTAEIWVRVDTVFGNSSQQYILLYWGKTGVSSRSNGSAVFETENYFQGVWHLSESPAGGAGALKDRTANGNHATPQNNLAADDLVNGIVGRALNFDGPNGAGGDWLRLPNASTLDNTGTLTISCWCRMTNGGSTGYYGIAGKYADSGSRYLGYTLCRADNQHVRFIAGTGSSASYIASNNPLTDNAWHHLVGAVYAGTLYLFIDGVQQSATAAGTPVANGGYGAIGRQAVNLDWRHFAGDIDEVKISRTARPLNWIRLSYANQRADQKLVTLEVVDNENYATWPYSQRLYLNTSQSGAGVNGMVVNFPALIRLNPAVFRYFSQTQPGGADLRFSRPDGAHLPYDIERWVDGSGNADTAEIWVRIDTVSGNSVSQYITMHWGRSDAQSRFNPRAVFDVAAGFAGVWHMNETPGAAGSIADRTANAFSGTAVNMNAAASMPGLIGRALEFDGVDDHIVLPAIPTDFTAGITIGGWMRFRAFNSFSRLIDWSENGPSSNNIAISNSGTGNGIRYSLFNGNIAT
ncbi:MAG: DUF2341 domain-containing protein, partial [Chitinispirillaceae bacterium]|nr:DUF2341 domain-containing protein [Chitinispirillaceae bacterium]